MNIENGRWAPGIGDPTIVGWVTFFVYFAVAVICIKAAITADSKKPEKQFWLYLTIFLIALGINKQLDLQSLLIQIGRDIAIAQGWYKDRQIFQIFFILLLGLSGITGIFILIKKYCCTNNAIKIAFIGCATLFVFILIRASIFQHIDILLNIKLADIRVYGALELGGLVIIAIGGNRYKNSYNYQ